jgi:hypothetical protein
MPKGILGTAIERWRAWKSPRKVSVATGKSAARGATGA